MQDSRAIPRMDVGIYIGNLPRFPELPPRSTGADQLAGSARLELVGKDSFFTERSKHIFFFYFGSLLMGRKEFRPLREPGVLL